MTEHERIRRKKVYKEIKQSLIDQLIRSGNDKQYFLDLVDDYMALYIEKELCKRDIEERGINIRSIGSAGQEKIGKNDSIDTKIKLHGRMLDILEKLKIKPDADIDFPDDEM